MDDSENRPLLGVRVNPSWERGPFAPSSSSVPRQASNGGNRRSKLQKTANQDVTRGSSSNIQSLLPTNASSSWHVRCAVFAILLSVVLERVSFYGLTGNLVLFLNKTPFNWESYHAMNALFLFYGIMYIVSLIGGWIADSCLGRFKAMLLAFLIYICGYVLMPFIAQNTHTAANNSLQSSNTSDSDYLLPKICVDVTPIQGEVVSPFEENCAWLIYVTLIIIGIGAGTLKASFCPFGSEQLTRASQQTQLSFFNWFYWCVNFGSFVGLGAIAYIQQQHSFEIGFIIGAITLGCSGLVFIFGRCCYISRPPDGSVLSNIFRIIREAWKRKIERQQLRQLHKKSDPQGYVNEQLTIVEEKIGFLDHAKHRHGGIFHNSLVDDVKKLGMILAVFAVLIPYWIVYFQMQTTFLFQGLHMKLGFHVNMSVNSSVLSGNNSTIVAAWFTLFDASFVIILLPLFDRVIYPRMSRAGYPFKFTKRIVLGMVFAMLAMIVAGVVEHFRLQSFWPYPDQPCRNQSINQKIGNSVYEAADMTVFWQIPQYALIGISEVFTSVACPSHFNSSGLQFAVTVAPKSMKAIITGLFYFFSGISSFLGTAILTTLASTQTWFNRYNYGNINCRLPCNSSSDLTYTQSCHLDYYFYMLAGIDLVAIFLFLVVSNKFKLNADQLALNVRPKEDQSSSGNRHIQRHSDKSPPS
ncbi:unnamed protein product [Lymnaea stagnalis]|uniref:Uncharacterized protein n=1 Tax=Lymnaea stagnalis TaxID=6523 RepID=A0AAV2I4P0_LYMST